MKYILLVFCLLSSLVLLNGANARRGVLASSSAKASASSSASSTNSECSDITPPPGRFTCTEQKKFGKCNACWMTKGGFCKKTCNLCDVKDTTKLPCFQDPPPSPKAEEEEEEDDCNVEIEYADSESEARARARRCGKALAAGTEGGRASAETEGGEVASIARGEGSTATSQSSPGQAFASSTVVGGGSASASARD